MSKPISQLTQADELKQSPLERSFVTAWRQLAGRLPEPVVNYVFSDERDFEIDFAWSSVRVGVECHGIRDHASVKGAMRDWEKMNLAHLEGWTIFIVWTKMLDQDPASAIEMIADFIRDKIDDRAAREEARETMRQYAQGAANRALMLVNSAADAVGCAAKRGT